MMPLGKIAGSASALCRIKIGLEAPLMDGTLPPPCDPGVFAWFMAQRRLFLPIFALVPRVVFAV